MTKTYAEFISETPTIFNNTDMSSDTATQTLIYDWFQYRRVSSNTKFPTYFRRVINRDYSRYLQLLRIEAGKATNGVVKNYDWLINNYLTSVDDNNVVNSSNSNTDATNMSESNTDSNSNMLSSSSSQTDDSSNADTSSLAETSSSATNSSESSGSTESAAASASRAGSIGRANPMTQDFSNADMSAQDVGGVYVSKHPTTGKLDVQKSVASSGSPDPANSIGGVTGLNKNFPDLHIQNPTTTSDSLTNGGSVNESHTSTTGSGSNSGSSDTSAVTSSAQTGTSKSESENSSLTEGRTNNTTTSVGSTGTTNNSNTDAVNNHLHEGQNGNTAPMLLEVIRYIDKSSAFDWFRRQLETCFISVFKEEDYA